LPVLVIGGQAVGVCLRTSRRNQDGSTVRYLSIAHNVRSPGGPSVAKVLLPLGREDRLDVAALRRLVGSINRYLGEGPGSDAGEQVGAEPGGRLSITDSAPAGGAWLLDGLWRQLGIGTALREVLRGRRFDTDVERVLFALMANRALARPASWPPRTGPPPTWSSPGLPAWMRTRPIGRWSCWWRPTPTRRCRKHVLCRGAPAQPRGRPAALAHHPHLLRTRW